ncbi:MAG TPA: SIS domain-containing protein [Acidobacteriaceae bacterium]|nr:SIS domain-containing protein [Acidobacteriaceae bacterium]
MLREIFEQPQAIDRTLDHYLHKGGLAPDVLQAAHRVLLGHERVVIAASGSSRHAGLAGEIMLEDIAGLAIDVEYASEYCYRSTHTLNNPAVIVISQSGETADTLAALREAHSRGLQTAAITNRAGSTMATEARASLPVCAGPEKAIPATKSFTGQLLVLYLLALSLAHQRGRMTLNVAGSFCAEARQVPELITNALPGWQQQVHELAQSFRHASAFLFLGRGVHYAIAREGALKLKEASLIHAEGYPAGELKHGPNALVGPETPVVILATHDASDRDSVMRYSKVVQLLRDLKAQGASVFALANEGDKEVENLSQHCVFIPRCNEYLLPLCEVVPLQLFAYEMALLHGRNVDNPRNLVKAVVEE